MSNFAIEIKGLNKTYKAKKKSPAKEALKNIDLQIKKGSFFGLLGDVLWTVFSPFIVSQPSLFSGKLLHGVHPWLDIVTLQRATP